jgi:hypothetical protein
MVHIIAFDIGQVKQLEENIERHTNVITKSGLRVKYPKYLEYKDIHEDNK